MRSSDNAHEKRVLVYEVLRTLHNYGPSNRDQTYDEVVRELLLQAEPFLLPERNSRYLFELANTIDLNNIQEDIFPLPNGFCWFESPILTAGSTEWSQDPRRTVAITWGFVFDITSSSPDAKIGSVKLITDQEAQSAPRELVVQAFTNSSRPRPTLFMTGRVGCDMSAAPKLQKQHLQFLLALNRFYLKQRQTVKKALKEAGLIKENR